MAARLLLIFRAALLVVLTAGNAVAADSYMGMVIGEGASAMRSGVQLWNPANSGKVLRINSISLANQATGAGYPILGLDLRMLTEPLENSSSVAAPKSVGAPTAVGQLRWENFTPSAQGIPGIASYEYWVNQESTEFYYVPPLEIGPGQGAMIVTAKPDISSEPMVWLIVSLQWEEADL